MICSSVSRERFIVHTPSMVPDSTQIWRKFRGSGHRVNPPITTLTDEPTSGSGVPLFIGDDAAWWSLRKHSAVGVPGKKKAPAREHRGLQALRSKKLGSQYSTHVSVTITSAAGYQ
jgi:hypothetical protein